MQWTVAASANILPAYNCDWTHGGSCKITTEGRRARSGELNWEQLDFGETKAELSLFLKQESRSAQQLAD